MTEAGIADLLRRALEGDQAAWDAIVTRYSPFVWRIARSHRLPDKVAEDVVQTTWLRLIEKGGDIRDPERLGGWLGATARNESLRQLRREGRQVPTDDVEALGAGRDHDAPEIDARLLRGERRKALAAAFARISAPCRRLLSLLASTPPIPYVDIGATLDMPVGSIGPTRARCIARLRDELAAEGFA